MSKEVYGDPSSVKPKRGSVKVDGSDAVDVEMTPEAAHETGERLQEAAIKAKASQYWRPD